MHRIVIRGTSHKRQRPQNSRFVGLSLTAPLIKRDMKTGFFKGMKDISTGFMSRNWLGKSWKKQFNKGKMPSLNQIQNGLIAEAMVQLQLSMGNVKDQLAALEAKENIKETWEDLMKKAKINDRDDPLVWSIWKPLGLSDPTYPVVALCNFIYQMENFVYKELNRASRFKDTSKIETLGPFAAAMGPIIENA